jgi:Flp pilus assembly protein TadG
MWSTQVGWNERQGIRMSERITVQRDTRKVGQRRRERGQSLVETAIVFPILLLLLAAVVDFGRAFDAYIVLTNAAREGARWGSVNPELSVADVGQIVVDDVLGSGTNVTQMTGFYDDPDDPDADDNVKIYGQLEELDFVRVTVTYEFPLWFGRLIGVPEVTLSKVSEMPRWRND